MICLRQDWKNFFLMKVISVLSPDIPLNTFCPSYSKSSYLMLLVGSRPESKDYIIVEL
jgi:hypothetical protein